MTYEYLGQDGRAWIVRAHSLTAARAQAHCYEKRRTGSVAAGRRAAASLRAY